MPISKKQIVTLGLLGLLAAFVFAVFTLGSEANHKLQPNDFVTIYNTKAYQALVDKISHEKYVIIEGKAEDGVDVFASYVFNTTLKDDSIVYQRIFTEEPIIEDSSYPTFSMIRSFITDAIKGEETGRVWIIDTNGPLNVAHLQAVELLASAEKNDRIVLIAEEAKVKSKTFKKITYPRPSESSIQSILKAQGLTSFQVERVLNHHQGNLEQLKFSFDQNSLLEYEKALETERAQITSELNANPKAFLHIRKLCKNGHLASKKEIPELESLESIDFQNGHYLWISNNHLQAYEIVNEVDCKEPASYAQLADPEPPVVVEEVVTVVEETPQKKDKKEKKEGKEKKVVKEKVEVKKNEKGGKKKK